MSDNENAKENQVNNATPLSENELSDVSGGLWGITIIDSCPQTFHVQKCCRNFGKCPNLVIKSWNTRMDNETNSWVQDYVLSCSKGYFYNENLTTNKQIPNY